jgi:hypothetical protein
MNPTVGRKGPREEPALTRARPSSNSPKSSGSGTSGSGSVTSSELTGGAMSAAMLSTVVPLPIGSATYDTPFSLAVYSAEGKTLAFVSPAELRCRRWQCLW